MMSAGALPVRVGANSRYTRYWVGEYNDLALVVLELVGPGFRFKCYYCDGQPTYCLHINAVRDYRRQAYLEGNDGMR